MSTLEDLDRRVMWHPFTQMAEWEPLVIERGEGNYLIDSQGRRYLDGVSSLWCNVHGHNHPRLNRALQEQLGRIAHSTFLGLTHEPGIRLGAALVEAAPARAIASLLLGLGIHGSRDRAEAVIPVLAAEGARVQAAIRPARRGLSRRHARRGGRRRHRPLSPDLRAAPREEHCDSESRNLRVTPR